MDTLQIILFLRAFDFHELYPSDNQWAIVAGDILLQQMYLWAIFWEELAKYKAHK